MRKRIWTRNEMSVGRCSGARSTVSFLSICLNLYVVAVVLASFIGLLSNSVLYCKVSPVYDPPSSIGTHLPAKRRSEPCANLTRNRSIRCPSKVLRMIGLDCPWTRGLVRRIALKPKTKGGAPRHPLAQSVHIDQSPR